jgi:hypothetical protein
MGMLGKLSSKSTMVIKFPPRGLRLFLYFTKSPPNRCAHEYQHGQPSISPIARSDMKVSHAHREYYAMELEGAVSPALEADFPHCQNSSSPPQNKKIVWIVP